MRSICRVTTTSIMRNIHMTIVPFIVLQKKKEGKSIKKENDLYHIVVIENDLKPVKVIESSSSFLNNQFLIKVIKSLCGLHSYVILQLLLRILDIRLKLLSHLIENFFCSQLSDIATTICSERNEKLRNEINILEDRLKKYRFI